MLFYPAALPLSRQTLTYTAGVIRRHRAQIGSCWRKLNPGQQALLVLAYLRKGETFAELAAGFGVGTATAWRYVTETVGLLAARSPKLRRALANVTQAGHAYVVLDGTLVPIDRVVSASGSADCLAGSPAGSSSCWLAVGLGAGRGHCGAAVAAARPATRRERGERVPPSALRCRADPRPPGPGLGPFSARSSKSAAAAAISASVAGSLPRAASSRRAWFQACSPNGTGPERRCVQVADSQPPWWWLRIQTREMS